MMMVIYKYTSWGKAILEGKKVKISRATELNDPFELSPGVDRQKHTLREFRRGLVSHRMIDSAYKKFLLSGGKQKRVKFERAYRADAVKSVGKLFESVDQNVEIIRKDFAATFDETWRLFCASRISNSILMWSHYAKNHTGVVIGFDLSKMGLGEHNKFVVPVSYAAEKEEFHFAPDDEEAFFEGLRKVVARKSADWTYEQEIRLIVPISQSGGRSFFHFDEKSISTLAFGCRCPMEDRNALEKVIRSNPAYSHVKLGEYILDDHQFSLQYRELNS